MRRDQEFFGDQELVLVYMARRLKEAIAIEEVLTAGALEYLVEPAPFTTGILFRSERVGAFFYVEAQAEGLARSLILQSGFKPAQP